LNRLVSGLSSGGESSAVLLDEPLDNPKGETTAAIMEIEERTSMEIERLKRAIREKELALAAKSAEIEITKQEMSGRNRGAGDGRMRMQFNPGIAASFSSVT
jgi:hypothetical protein